MGESRERLNSIFGLFGFMYIYIYHGQDVEE